MVPVNILKYAKEFIDQIEERDNAYEKQDNDKAFDIEVNQRENGVVIANWIIEQAKKQTEPSVKCPYCLMSMVKSHPYDFNIVFPTQKKALITLSVLIEKLIMHDSGRDDPLTDGEMVDLIVDVVKEVKEGGDVPALLEKYDLIVDEDGEIK